MENPFSIRSEMGIRKRVFALLIMLFIPFLLLEIHVFYNWFQSLKASEKQANLELARAVAKNFETFLHGIIREELALGLAMTMSRPMSDSERDRLFDELQSANPAVRSIFWMDGEGRVIASSLRAYTGLALQKRAFFQSIVEKRDWAVSELFVGWTTGRPAFTISRAIRSENGELLGFAAVLIEPEALEDVLGVGRSADATVNLIDENGMLVFCYPPKELSWEQRKWLKNYPILAEPLKGREMMADVESFASGAYLLAAFAPVSSIGWVAACSRSEKEVTAALLQTLMPQIMLTMLLTLLGFGGAVMLSRPITGSILRLQAHAAAFGRGEMRPIALGGPIELERFADTLNHMAEAIRSRETALLESEARYRQAMEKSQALNRIGEALHATLDFEAIVQRIVAEGSALLGSESAAVSLLQEGRWVIKFGHGMPTGLIAHMMKDMRPCVEHALSSRQPVPVDDTLQDKRLDRDHMRRHNTRSVLIAPLVIRSEALGVLLFNYHAGAHRFSAEEIDFVRQMVNIAGAALSNAGLFKELEESNQELSEFGHALTHNLRAPLRAVQNYSQFLLEDLAETVQGDPKLYLEGLQTAVRQGHDQIEDLETLYRIKQHTVTTEFFALQELFDELQSIFKNDTGQQLVAEGPCPALCGERFLLRQILIELIRNGFKFNQSEPKRVVVSCKPRADHNGIEIQVRDNGIGIPPEHQDRIFRIFQRLHAASEYEGTGIGLAIVKRAVQKMGGTLRLESAVGQGSRFCIHLPQIITQGEGVC